MNIKLLMTLLAILSCSVGSATAATIYDFSAPPDSPAPQTQNTVLGLTASYTSNLVTITAAGFDATSTSASLKPLALFRKNDGGDENGLGLANITSPSQFPVHSSPHNEINTYDFIQLDVNNLLAFNPYTITIGSLQSGGSFAVYGTNTAGDLTSATFLQGGNGNQTNNGLLSVTFTDSFRYLDIIGTNEDVLLNSLSMTSVPEPSTGIFAGTVLAGLAIYYWRRARRS